MSRGEDKRIQSRRCRLGRFQPGAETILGVILAREVDGQGSSTRSIVSTNGRPADDALPASEAGRSSAGVGAASISQLDDIPSGRMSVVKDDGESR